MYNIRRIYLISTLLLTLLSTSISSAEDSSALEKNQTDALYKISKFITWPHYIMNQNNLLFCFYGEKIQNKEYQSLNGQSLHQRKIRTIHLKDIKNAQDCQLVFTTTFDKEELKTLESLSKENAILTISSNKNFLQNGGMIQLYYKNKRIQLNINQAQIEASDLSVNSSLLNITAPENGEQTL